MIFNFYCAADLKMNAFNLLKIFVIFFMILGMQQNVAARTIFNTRVKRVSDPHFSDLETRVALNKINGIAITLPVAVGRDLDKIGRKRRSESSLLETLFNQSEEEQGNRRRYHFEPDELEKFLLNFQK